MSTVASDERAVTSSKMYTPTERDASKPYIAIVDDDSAFASYLRTFLSLRGYEARCYTRGDELLAAMKQTEPPDAVLLDVMMPGLDGMATLRALKASRPEAQVIMLSGRNQASTIVEAVRAGATDYVVKPDDPEGLGEIALDVAIKNAIEKNRLVSELSELRQQLSDDEDLAVWGNSESMRRIATVIDQVGDSDVAVLLRGESGVGKELVSRAIHQRSTRRSRPFVKVNCAALPAELLESELFGHEKGAFTGAVARKIGRFEQAGGGTLFLDEIADMSLALQAKILRAVQEREIERVGGGESIPVTVRLIAATNRDLQEAIAQGRFREDLYYRLAVVTIQLPRLVDRGDDLIQLVAYFARQFGERYGKRIEAVSDRALELLRNHQWVGNVRELRNVIERAAIVASDGTLRSEHLPDELRAEEPGVPERAANALPTLAQAEARHIARVLQHTGGQIGSAADILGIHRNTLTRKMKEYGL